jgi:hypothetical protein
MKHAVLALVKPKSSNGSSDVESTELMISSLNFTATHFSFCWFPEKPNDDIIGVVCCRLS